MNSLNVSTEQHRREKEKKIIFLIINPIEIICKNVTNRTLYCLLTLSLFFSFLY